MNHCLCWSSTRIYLASYYYFIFPFSLSHNPNCDNNQRIQSKFSSLAAEKLLEMKIKKKEIYAKLFIYMKKLFEKYYKLIFCKLM